MEPSPSRVIVFVVDRLGAHHLGPYGNTVVETPNFNRLAFDSLLVENGITCSPDLADVYHDFWQPRSTSLIDLLNEQQWSTTLLTDESTIAELPTAQTFESVRYLETLAPSSPASSLDETQLARITAEAIDAIGEMGEGSLLWVHAQGMAGAWDAPVELRNSLADEEDPDPPQTAVPPSLVLEPDADPDIALGWSQAYQGQVMLLDTCVGVLLDAIESMPEPWLLIVTSPRGCALGEHQVIGDASTQLYGEVVHVPWFIRRSDGVGAAVRMQSLVRPCDLPQSLSGYLSPEANDATSTMSGNTLWQTAEAEVNSWQRTRAIIRCDNQRAIRTPAWFYRQDVNSEVGIQGELFRKPDDRWEANEVAALCPDVVELLQAELAKGNTDDETVLADLLLTGPE